MNSLLFPVKFWSVQPDVELVANLKIPGLSIDTYSGIVKSKPISLKDAHALAYQGLLNIGKMKRLT